MMDRTLSVIIATALQHGQSSVFLAAVRQAVYGADGYNSFYRIDDCELTSRYVSLRVSDRRTGKTVFSWSQRYGRLRRVA